MSALRQHLMYLILVGVEQFRCLEFLFGQGSKMKQPTFFFTALLP